MNDIMKRNYHQNLDIPRVNTMPDRAYYIPCPADARTAQKEENPGVIMLNGMWDFAYYPSAAEADPLKKGRGKIPVPSNWQFQGYEVPVYENIDYLIPYMPPFVPKENPCGCYHREFQIEKKGRDRFFLDLEGADSCHYVYINGEFAGYSQVSHSTAEYEITGLLKDGSNEISIAVLKWCDGTYLEDQDKYRLSGIFRDVYILRRPEKFIFDYAVQTKIGAGKADVTIRMKTIKTPGAAQGSGEKLRKKITLTDREGHVAAQKKTLEDELTLEIADPVLWNAEQPYLYDMEIETEDERILERVGVREVCVKDRQVLVNGRSILLRGVNRHESWPDIGYVCSRERMEQDLQMIKRANVNAIRTSHYPDCPEFYRLCDEYGFYVMDEADMESHGTWDMLGTRDIEQYSETQTDPRFKTAVIDRAARLAERDKNRPCVLFWSLGNESGYGENTVAAAYRVHEIDSTRPVHYESLICKEKDKGKLDESCLDVKGIMYPELEDVAAYCEGNPQKPLILTEYAHAMGNGPGNLKEYYDQFYRYEALAGGFVWEWCDHAVLCTAKNGEKQFLYGGDFGEEKHDRNFCVDGLVWPDRRPHTGLKELWNCARPAAVTETEDGYRITNRMHFTDLKDYLDIRWSIRRDGELLEKGAVEGLSVPPGESRELVIPHGEYPGERVFLKINLYKKGRMRYPEDGTLLGFEQFRLDKGPGTASERKEPEEETEKMQAASADEKIDAWKLQISETEDEVLISGQEFSYRFDKAAGNFSSLIYRGKEYLHDPVEYQMYRAPLDNDMYLCGREPGGTYNFRTMGFDRIRPYTYKTTAENREGTAVIRCRLALAARGLAPLADMDAVFTVDGAGSISMRLHTKIREDIPWLPRFGVRLHMDRGMDTCTYFGYGPTESYVDKHEGTWAGRFTGKVEEMFEHYIYPQENSSHFGTEYCILSDEDEQLRITSEKPFSFSVSEYEWEELERKEHDHELKKCGDTVLHLDYYMSGVGTGSCGPMTRPEYRMNKKDFCAAFLFTWSKNAGEV